MLALCPAEFIHALTTSSGVLWPFAIFSPAPEYVAPASFKAVLKALPSGLVCEKDFKISFALILAAAFTLLSA